jgi:excisionase family DNA binding protein
MGNLAAATTDPRPRWTVREAAMYLGVPVSWVYARVESGELPSYKFARYVRLCPAEVTEWMEAQRRGAAQVSAPAFGARSRR